VKPYQREQRRFNFAETTQVDPAYAEQERRFKRWLARRKDLWKMLCKRW